jgi:homoserine dehydrogenase
MPGPSSIGIVLLGLGTVGSGVAQALTERTETYSRRVGVPLELRKVLVRDPRKQRPLRLDPALLTADPDEALSTPCDIVVEVIGGEKPAREYIERAVADGRRVVTANKEVMAKYGTALLSAATSAGVDILYEASVGGGIPIISPLKRDLSGNEITGIRAIINGTTNYILTQMGREEISFGVALKEAQKLGYAEADPTNDVDAHDAVYKLSILAGLAFHTTIDPSDIYREGITRLGERDFQYASELGYTIKLLAVARRLGDSVEARVHPTLIPNHELLTRVDGALNAVQVDGDLIGRVLFQGAGAGSLPTTSAIMADVLDAARSISLGSRPFPWRYTSGMTVTPMTDLVSRYYMRLEVADKPGVLAVIAGACGNHGVSIASVLQKETDSEARSAELVIMTHSAKESDVQASIQEIESAPDVLQVGNVLRVEH